MCLYNYLKIVVSSCNLFIAQWHKVNRKMQFEIENNVNEFYHLKFDNFIALLCDANFKIDLHIFFN